MVGMLDRPKLLLPNICAKYLNFPFIILFIFKILRMDTQIAYEFQLSFQNLRECQLIGFFFPIG